MCGDSTDKATVFLSTPSGWRATRKFMANCETCKFLSTPSGWRATVYRQSDYESTIFLSTPSGWRATSAMLMRSIASRNFYPRPPGGGRRCLRFKINFFVRYFYPRPPGGGRRFLCLCLFCIGRDFYPRPPGGGRLWSRNIVPPCAIISIHALRVEGDI